MDTINTSDIIAHELLMTSQAETCVLEDVFKTNRGAPTAIIVLVHGTAARGAAWTRLGSPMCDAISRPDYDVYRFLWSGENSHDARLTAGQCFREKLTELIRQPRNKDAHLFVVAHSHGGNVSLYGMSEELRQRVTGVVCLATPFLHFYPITLRTKVLLYLAGFSVPILLILLLVLGLIGLTGLHSFIWVIAGVVVGLLLVLTLVFRQLRRAGLHFPLRKILRTIFKTDIEKLAQQLKLPDLDWRKLLIIKPVADEAAGALVSSQFSAWLARKIFGSVGRFWEMFVSVLAAVSVLTWVSYLFLSQESYQSLSSGGDAVLIATMWVVMAVAFFVMLIIMFANGPFGYDALALAFRGQTAAESSPLGKAVVVLVALSGFRHSEIYKAPPAIDQVATFIETFGKSLSTVREGKRE